MIRVKTGAQVALKSRILYVEGPPTRTTRHGLGLSSGSGQIYTANQRGPQTRVPCTQQLVPCVLFSLLSVSHIQLNLGGPENTLTGGPKCTERLKASRNSHKIICAEAVRTVNDLQTATIGCI